MTGMSYRARVLGALACVASLLAFAAQAKARPRVAILDLAIAGDAPPELRAELERSLAGGLSSVGFAVVSREDTLDKLKEAPELIGCSTTTCLERIGHLVGATRFVRGRVVADGAAFAIELELLSADISGSVVTRVERSCAVCTLAEANDTMSSAALALDEKTLATGKLLVYTMPPGGRVTVDGNSVGMAPTEVELAPGEHRIQVALEGYLPGESHVAVQAGQTQEVTVALLAPVLPQVSRFRVWKWAAGGVAVASLMAGITLMAIDGGCTDSPPAGQECKDLHDTLWGGAALTAAGVLLGGATVYMVLEERPRLPPASERRFSVRPLREGVVAMVRFGF